MQVNAQNAMFSADLARESSDHVSACKDASPNLPRTRKTTVNADEALRQLDAAILDVMNVLDALKQVPSTTDAIERAIHEFFEEAWDHIRLLTALREEAGRVEWSEPDRRDGA